MFHDTLLRFEILIYDPLVNFLLPFNFLAVSGIHVAQFMPIGCERNFMMLFFPHFHLNMYKLKEIFFHPLLANPTDNG